MQEMPSIRFRASKPIGDDAGSGLETQALVSQRVALELNDRLQGFQRDGILPASQSCDLIILDRCRSSSTAHLLSLLAASFPFDEWKWWII